MNDRLQSAAIPGGRFETAGHWLLRLREEALSEQELSQWIEWCEAHPENLAAFEELQALWTAAGEHPPALHLRPTEKESAWVRWRPRARLALAASLAILAVTVTIFWSNRPIRTNIQTIAAVDRIATPVAQNRDAVLSDGSSVAIGARSLLEVDFTPVRRQLQLREGQAFFKVERDRERPFVVEAGGLQIQAIGTSFDVRHGAHSITVTVQEGVVRISRDGQINVLRLEAGRQLTFDSTTGHIRENAADPAVAVAWRSGRLEVTGDSLETVIASVNRYSSRPVVLSDPQLGKLNFTGTVFVDSIDASLDALEQVFPIEIHRDEKQTIIASRG